MKNLILLVMVGQYRHCRVCFAGAGVVNRSSAMKISLPTRKPFYGGFREADAVLVSWNTVLTKETLSQCHKLRYVGLCVGNYFNKPATWTFPCCREKGITVTESAIMRITA